MLGILERSGFFDDEHRLIVSATSGGVIAKFARMLAALGAMVWWVGLRRVVIVHLHVAAFNSFWRKAIFLRVAKILGAKVVLHWHSPRLKQFVERDGGSARARIERVFIAANLVVTVSMASRQELIELFPTLRPQVVYNPVDDGIMPVPQDRIRENADILYMAALLREKGVFDLVDAFVEVRKVCRDARLTICGSGLDRELREYIESRGLASEVRMPGWVTGDERNNFFREAAVFCLPSRADTFAMANLDAMAAGLPVVSTTHGGIPEVVQDGFTGLLVTPGDVAGLAEKLIHLLSDPDLRVRMGLAGRQVAHERFSVTRLMTQLAGIYDKLG